MFCLCALNLAGKAQNAAQAQQVKKTNTPAATNTKPTAAPWEKQPILPAKTSSTHDEKGTGIKPGQAQPIRSK